MKFLTAHWKNLIFINYKITAELLYEYLPAHMELDDYRGQYYVSVVAFKFHDTRLKGVKIPFHVNFDEINLAKTTASLRWFIHDLSSRQAMSE